jgi:hypothetical protein
MLRGLDPASALCEITCGLVMTLTIMLTAGYYVEGSDDPAKSLLTAALGCTLAWGLIDGMLYVMSDFYARARKYEFLRTLRAKPAEGRAILLRRAEDDFAELLSEAQIEDVVDAVSRSAMRLQPREPGFTRTNLSEIATTVACNMVAVTPAALPFLLLRHVSWQTNLRVSNVLVVAMLFAVGFGWGKAAGFRPWRTGATLLAIGVAMVGIAVELGG